MKLKLNYKIMTLRVHYNEIFRSWNVEALNTWTGNWNTCSEYYPKVGREVYASFKTEEEAKEFMDWKSEKLAKDSKILFTSETFEIPTDYYGVRGRYYGD